MKTQKKEKKQSGERGVRKISIRTKLSLIFFVPVICMVALGIISYYQAANVVIENSKRETGQTLNVLAEAYQTKFEMVQSQIDEYYQDMDMREYLSGAYNLFDTKAVQYYNASLSAVKSKVWSNPSISGIEIVAGKTDSILYNEHKNDNLYQELSATKLGETLLADKQKYHWFGKSGEVDEMMGIDGADYLFRVGMHFPKHEAYVVAQMPEQTVADIIKELTFGENSIVGVLSSMCTTAEKIFSSPTRSLRKPSARSKYSGISDSCAFANSGLVVIKVSTNFTLSLRTRQPAMLIRCRISCP